MRIIGLTGKARSGKSTVAKHLVEKYGFYRFAFIEPLKEMLIKAGMCTKDELYDHKTEQSRWLMQKIGTEIFREQIDKRFWIHQAEDVIMDFQNDNSSGSMVFDDIRFPNEADLIHSFSGTVIKLIRKDYNDQATDNSHLSESLVDGISCDFEIVAESGDVPGLLLQVEKVLMEGGNENT